MRVDNTNFSYFAGNPSIFSIPLSHVVLH